jgi:hypothetical protein
VNLLGTGLELYARARNARLRRAAASAAGCQHRVLRTLLRRAERTRFGREHGFDSIDSPEQFRRRVPIRDYVAYLPWVERMLQGQSDVCWPGRVKQFAKTSGTTAGDKNIPVTREMQRANTRAALALFSYYARRGPGRLKRLMRGKLLFLGGSTALATTSSGALVGDLSGIATGSIRGPLADHYEPGLEIALLDDWEEKIQRVAQRVARRDIRFVTGMPSWVKILFDRVCLLRGVDPSGGISRVWPNLQLLVHGGVNFAPYRATFEGYFREDHGLDYLEVYPASEGFIAIQAEADSGAMELQVDNGIYYEFVPLDQWHGPGAPRLGLEEVQPGVAYSVVISTNAGLWAYDIGDVVRFVSVDPPRILFAGRNKLFINAFGENVIAEQLCEAVARAAELTGASVLEFTAGPTWPAGDKPGRHEYAVEFSAPPAGGCEAFAARLDEKLRQLNNDYDTKRGGDLGMRPPLVRSLPPGAFYAWMKRCGKLGGQHKVPTCANDRRYLDELIDTGREMERGRYSPADAGDEADHSQPRSGAPVGGQIDRPEPR